MEDENIKYYLLPYYFKKLGIIGLFIGLFFIYVRFAMGIKPIWLEMKVFAVYNSIFKTTYFSFVKNNISEEIGLLFTGVGLFLITLSREKIENDIVWELRTKAFIYSIYINFFIFVFFVLFVYGWGFLLFMGINLFLYFIIYNIVFQYFFYLYRKKRIE